MPTIKRFPIFYTTLPGPHTNTKQRLYCIHKNKKHYEHTSYPTYLKARDKYKDHEYAELLIPHSQRVVTHRLVLFSVQTH
jgi:hypothetical protein